MAVLHLIYPANLTWPPRLDQPLFLTAFKGYLFLMLLWLGALLIRFGRTPKQATALPPFLQSGPHTPRRDRPASLPFT